MIRKLVFVVSILSVFMTIQWIMNDDVAQGSNNVENYAVETPSINEQRNNEENAPISDNLEVKMFSVYFNSEVSTAGQALGTLEYRFNLALKPQRQGEQYLGRVYDIKWPELEAVYSKPDTLAFKTQFKNGQFTQVDLLGLDDKHPLAMIRPLLAQMSYSEGVTQLQLEGGMYTFKFKRLDNKTLTRTRLESAENESVLDVLSESDDWHMIHDDAGFPLTMKMSHAREVRYPPNVLAISQKAFASRVADSVSLSWQSEQFDSGANSAYFVRATERPDEAPAITNENLRENLSQLASNTLISKVRSLVSFLYFKERDFRGSFCSTIP
ncbi:hypothetical protein CS022_05890 [Veronia nyctiphanis]|uniref:Uncharacterized protein n=1 Tax=Veronia nyctiphanis TaxID=1278244 RepID=A0A4Q0YSD3_9GAMM|nr:hypothetical protein [Veronia nyctiphanis]RXJ74147.1 hypothetical protein CS022_05890 [Veronia nyctiphanis]